MKRIYPLLLVSVCSWLGLACTENALPEAVPQPWNVTVSRADAGTGSDVYNRILILGKKEGTTATVRGVLAVDGTTGSWENNATPTWPKDGTSDMFLDVYAVSPVPDGNEPPAVIDLTTGQGTAWQVDYQTDVVRPTSFTMTHILARLVVHIRIDGEVNPQPTDGSIRLYAKGNVDYSAKKVTTTELTEVPLGDFHQEGQEDHSTEHNWETENAIVVIPQTIPAGEPCLWFTAGGKEYTFTPQTNLNLEVGKVNNLHLGVTIGGPIFLEGISVTDWNTGGHLGDYEVEE